MKLKALLVIVGMILGALLYAAVFQIPTKTIAVPIVNKYEECDRYYLLLETEITPEEYIGYDIGDDYEILTTQ